MKITIISDWIRKGAINLAPIAVVAGMIVGGAAYARSQQTQSINPTTSDSYSESYIESLTDVDSTDPTPSNTGVTESTVTDATTDVTTTDDATSDIVTEKPIESETQGETTQKPEETTQQPVEYAEMDQAFYDYVKDLVQKRVKKEYKNAKVVEDYIPVLTEVLSFQATSDNELSIKCVGTIQNGKYAVLVEADFSNVNENVYNILLDNLNNKKISVSDMAELKTHLSDGISKGTVDLNKMRGINYVVDIDISNINKALNSNYSSAYVTFSSRRGVKNKNGKYDYTCVVNTADGKEHEVKVEADTPTLSSAKLMELVKAYFGNTKTNNSDVTSEEVELGL